MDPVYSQKFIEDSKSIPLPWIPQDMWWEISQAIENPNDWLEFRACCTTFKSVCKTRDFGIEGLRCIKILNEHTSYIRAMTIFEGNLITASIDRTIKFWNIKSGKCLKTLECSYLILSLTVFDSKLVSGSWNGK